MPLCFPRFMHNANILRHSKQAAAISAQLPLEGLRVLDLTRILAGPYCTMLLGDLGADVIKVEHPRAGDDTRAWGPPFACPNDATSHGSSQAGTDQGESAYFLGVNRNKRSIGLDLKTPQGQRVIHDLVQHCDVLVENYLPGKLASMGLGYDQLKDNNPRLIYASITGYGSTGPYANRPGYDVMIEAEAGLMYITGEPDRPPVKVGVAITDLTTGLYTHGAIMAALIARGRTGRGQHLDVSLLECQLASLANIASNYLVGGKEATRWGTAHASIVPYRGFSTQDGFIVIGGGNDRQFSILCKVLDLEHLCQDPKYDTNAQRVQHRDELESILETRLQAHTTDYWLKALEGCGIPYAPLNNLEQTFKHPQVMAREAIKKVQHPTIGPLSMVGPAVHYSQTPATIRRPPPLLGQHSEEILREVLGYSQAQIDNLIKAKVVRK
ncbi:hypothetical protein H4R35_005900 [Dimargaris xerosporica]|nr:hypothetical protein H4R35_005900 [Dimargaris xerosporica]